MADGSKDQDEANLELPSFGLLGKKKPTKRGKRVAGRDEVPSDESDTNTDPDPDPTVVPAAEESTARSEPEPTPQPEPAPAGRAQAGSSRPAVDREPEQQDHDPDGAVLTAQREQAEGGGRGLSLPDLAPRTAAAVTGLVVGVAGVLLTFLVLQGCTLVRGTGTCGGAGFPLLLAVLLVMVLIGRALLRGWGLPDAGGTAFLAVGLIAAISMLFLLPLLLSPAMVVLLPAVSVGAHLLSHFVTTAYVEIDDSDQRR